MNPKNGVFLLFVLAASLPLQAIELTLQEGVDDYAGTQDTSIYADQPDNSNGGGRFLYVGATGESLRRALIRFDLSAIPAGSSITSAALHLTVNQAGQAATDTDPHTLHLLTAAWGEGEVDAPDPGGSGAPAETDDATWTAGLHEGDAWQTSGGDFAPEPSAQANATRTRDSVLVLQSDLMARDVRNWVYDPATNFGWILLGNEEGARNARRFHSSEGAAAMRPRLVIDYSPLVSLSDWPLYE